MRLASFHPIVLRFAAALACCPSAVHAAPPVGIKTIAQDMSPRVSRCLIRREPALIDRWLRTLPGSAQEVRLVRSAEAGFSPCFDQSFYFQGGSRLPAYDTAGIRAALVRALLQARRQALPAEPLPGSGADWYPPDPGGDPAAIVAADLGACLARKHWRNLLAIVKAVDPGIEKLDYFTLSRKAEAAREREEVAVSSELSKVIPSIANCVPAGAKLRIERPRLRSLLEEAAYHMTNGNHPAAGEGAAFNDR